MEKTRKKQTVVAMLALAVFILAVALAVSGGRGIYVARGEDIGSVTEFQGGDEGNVMIFNCNEKQVRVELCTSRTVRVMLSADSDKGYRPYDPQYYMVQKNEWEPVKHTVVQDGNIISVITDDLEVRVTRSPFRIGMYDKNGNLLSKDSDSQGMYIDGDIVGVKKTEGSEGSGGIFGFGSGDHGRRGNLNRYDEDFDEFSMTHGRLIAPFFMSTVGYGIFLNTIEENTVFYKKGGGFATEGYLDYFFMYGPDFKTILNEYAEITGRMEMYGKWAHGFMLSKYGNDNATQEEFLKWIHRLRDEGYPADCYVFDYGWRGDVADNGGNQTGAGEKWGKQMWSNDLAKFPDIDAMFREADELGFRVGLHNNAGTPEANGGKNLYEDDSAWVKSYMDSVITTGYGDWFWPDEFDVLGSNTAPTFSSKGAYEAWKEYTDESRPMFVTRGSYAGQHFATAWSGDINNTSEELGYQIGFGIDAGLVGYWTTSHDLGGFMKAPSDELYTRWVAEFGAWNGIMRTHGHNGREPWLYSETAQNTLKKNLETRYALYPYIYTMAWQGYSSGVPMMRAMLLEDGSRTNPDAWDLNKQYYFGDWFLVAPATDAADTTVSVWLPPETTWYNYYNGKRYEGGKTGKTVRVAAALEEIPVFVKSGAIVPMGPDVDYADEKPLNPLTLDIYPDGTTEYTLYEDDGESRRYITENAYTTTSYTSVQSGSDIRFIIGERVNHNAAVYTPAERSYNLKFNHIGGVNGVTLDGKAIVKAANIKSYNDSETAYYYDETASVLYVRMPDTGKEMTVAIDSDGIVQPAEGSDDDGEPPLRIGDETVLEAETATLLPVSGGKAEIGTSYGGYSGNGYVTGFTAKDDCAERAVNIVRAGLYEIKLKVRAAKQTSLILSAGGEWLSIEIPAGNTWTTAEAGNVRLASGNTVFRILAAESGGDVCVDSVIFSRTDTSVDAFAEIKAEKASSLEGASFVVENGTTLIHSDKDGAYAQFDEIRGQNKGGVKIRVKSGTGGSIIVYENGVGDKILAEVAVPGDGLWHTLEVSGKNTDVPESNIFLEFRSADGKNPDIYTEWFCFTRSIDAFATISSVSCSARNNINIRNDSFLVNIYDGSYALYTDINFGETGAGAVSLTAASQNPGGTAEIYIDAIGEGNKLGEIIITSTGSWNTKKIFYGNLDRATGKHDVFVVFRTGTDKAICDFFEMRFYKNSVSVYTEVIGGTAAVQASNIMALPGESVTLQIYGVQSGKEVGSVVVKDSTGGNIGVETISKGSRYSFVMPEGGIATAQVLLVDKLLEIGKNTVLETEDGYGATNDALNALRVDKEWSGYSGGGYVAGWKKQGSYAEIKAVVANSGVYSVVLRGAAGKKNDATDLSPRSGALYVDGVLYAEFGLEIQKDWSVWINYDFGNIVLKAGEHTFRISAEGNNPGNYNIDCLTFVRKTDFSELENALKNADALNPDEYKPEGIETLGEITERASALLTDADAAQDIVDKAASDIAAAIAALEKVAPPHEHDFGEWITVNEPDCVTEGLQEQSCACGEKRSRSLPATGVHSFNDGKCSVCGTADPGYSQKDNSDCGNCGKADADSLMFLLFALAGAGACLYAGKRR